MRKLYSSVLALDDVSPVLQRRIFGYAQRNKELTLLAMLAGHRSLSPETDALLAAVPDARVRTAWLRNPRRDAAQAAALIASEKRVSVLAIVAGLDDELPDAVWETLASRAEAAKSTTLALALASNRQASDAARLRAAVVYAQHVPAVATKDLARFSALLPFADEMAAVSTSFNVAVLLADAPSLSSASVDRLTSIATGWIAERNAEGKFWVLDSAYQLLNTLLLHPMAPVSAAQTVLAAFRSPPPMHPMHPMQGPVGARVSPATLVAQAELLIAQGGGSGVTSGAAAAVRVESESDPAVLDTLIDGFRHGSTARALALVSNPHLSAEQFERLVGRCRWDWRLCRTIAQVLRDAPQRFAAFAVQYPYFFNDEMIAGAADPAALVSATADVAARSSQTYLLRAVVQSRFFAPQMLLSFPVQFCLATDLPVDVAQRLLEALELVVGDDGAWEAFEGLAPEFRGTLGELLTSASLLG